MFLYKNKITIKETNKARFFSGGLDAYIKQRPNKRFIETFRFGLLFYKMSSNKNNNRYNRFLRYRLGEAPVILDSGLIESSIRGMKSYLKTNGYYYPSIYYKVSGKLHKGTVNYMVELNNPYHIGRIDYHIADKKIDSLISSQGDESFLRLGNPIRLENILKEQIRINNIMRDNGYYMFNKDYVNFDMDTTLGNFYTSISVNISNDANFETFHTYQIEEISVEIENRPSDPNYHANDSSISYLFKSFRYKPNSYQLNPEVIERSLFVYPKSMFHQNKSNNTFDRLNQLQIFRLVNINAIPINNNTDSAALIYTIKLTPAKKYDYTIEPQAITTDQANIVTSSPLRNYGLATQITFSIKNLFHKAELFQLRYRFSIEAQRGASIPTRPFFNSFENSLNASLSLPKLVFFKRLDRRFSNTSNQSIISASSIYEKNVDWIRNVYTVGFSYQFNKKNIRYFLTPSEISFIKTSFNNKTLELQSKNDQYLQSVFNNNLITDLKFGFLYSNQTTVKSKDYFYVKWDVIEVAGNVFDGAYRLLNIPKNDSGYRTFLGVQYFQYVKTYFDIRFNKYLDENDRIATRFAFGCAVPYGNSPDYIPFDKRFFTGGANSIRAFLPRSIGPGSYNQAGQLDRSGDLKLEANVELRFNILNHFIEGALFVDAGNVWRIKNDGRAEATFYFNEFYKQIAVGTGFGIRLNLDFLIFRVDASFPMVDPRKTSGNRYVLNTYKDMSKLWGSTIFNFGVGYPF